VLIDQGVLQPKMASIVESTVIKDNLAYQRELADVERNHFNDETNSKLE
jgi:hypothetical protein